MAADTGLIVIGLSCALRQISFLHLIEVAPARYLLALDPGHNFESLEIALIDILDDVPGREKRERKLIAQLLQQIKRLRKTERMRMAEILFVRLAGKPSLEAAQR